jgi:hypothetical protein
VLYDFQNSVDGSNPLGELAPDGNGNLFGVTNSGTSANFVVIFKIALPPA